MKGKSKVWVTDSLVTKGVRVIQGGSLAVSPSNECFPFYFQVAFSIKQRFPHCHQVMVADICGSHCHPQTDHLSVLWAWSSRCQNWHSISKEEGVSWTQTRFSGLREATRQQAITSAVFQRDLQEACSQGQEKRERGKHHKDALFMERDGGCFSLSPWRAPWRPSLHGLGGTTGQIRKLPLFFLSMLNFFFLSVIKMVYSKSTQNKDIWLHNSVLF